jgi:hypothetical protein
VREEAQTGASGPGSSSGYTSLTAALSSPRFSAPAKR